MNKAISPLQVAVCLLLAFPSAAATLERPHESEAPRPSPVLFIENAGQWDERARYLVWGGPGDAMWLADDGIWITLTEQGPRETGRQIHREPGIAGSPSHDDGGDTASRSGVHIKLSFVDANPHPRLEPFDALDTVVSYFTGNEPAQWHAAVPVWGRVRYVDLYPGVDLELGSENGRLVQRLAVHAGADPAAVRLRLEGADDVSLAGDTLRLTTQAGDISLPLLSAGGRRWTGVQRRGDRQFEVAAALDAATSGGPALLAGLPSVADDPTDLLYATFLGGSVNDEGYGIAVDGSGSAYVTGHTYSSSFPTTAGAFDTSYAYCDVFVAKLNPSGSALTYATFLGGSDHDFGHSIVVDAAGSAYVGGDTSSGDFPTTPGAFDTGYNGQKDAFVVKLNPAGTALAYATFVGGSGEEQSTVIALDGAKSAYIAGATRSADFPATPGACDTSFNGGSYDAFVAKLSPAGSSLAYATFLGGSGEDFGRAIAVDGAGSAYVTGDTKSSSFPTTPGAFDTSYRSVAEAFVSKLSPSGGALLYSTFLGGVNRDVGQGIAVDAAGSAYVTGATNSYDFPLTPGAFDTSYPDGDAFVTKLNPAGSALVYSTLLGGTDALVVANGVTVDGAGNALVTGETTSGDFPATPGAFDTTLGGICDAFVARLNAAGSGLLYATFLGGSSTESGYAIAIGGAGSAYVVGSTSSGDFPTTAGAFDRTHNSRSDAVVAKLAVASSGPTPTPTRTRTPTPTATRAPGLRRSYLPVILR